MATVHYSLPIVAYGGALAIALPQAWVVAQTIGNNQTLFITDPGTGNLTVSQNDPGGDVNLDADGASP